MFRHQFVPSSPPLLFAAGALSTACSLRDARGGRHTGRRAEPAAVTTAAVESRPIDRYLRVTGSLLADEQAEVSAELAGRVIATPVERGTPRRRRARCWCASPRPRPSAQLQEAEANAGADRGAPRAERRDRRSIRAACRT